MISPVRWTVIASTVLLAVIAGFVVPIESVTVPEWKIQVVNREGVPQPGEEVRQTWKNYSLDFSDGPENYVTGFADSKGEITFPERRDSASLFYMMVALLYDLVKPLVLHSSTGIQATVYSPAAGSEFISCNGCSDPPGLLIIGSR
jgi:hypothetical protein